jgi:hypothetical protein
MRVAVRDSSEIENLLEHPLPVPCCTVDLRFAVPEK